MTRKNHNTGRLLLLFSLLLQTVTGFAEPQLAAALTVERQSGYQAQRLFAGRVLGGKRADIAFEFAGTLEHIAVDDGDHVEAGQELARLDTRALRIQQGELEATHRELTARYHKTGRELARFQELAKQAYVSKDQLDNLSSSHSVAAAQLQQNEERRRALELNLSKSILVAPFAGEVSGLQIEEGVVAQPGEPVLQLVEVAENEAVFGIPGEIGQGLVSGQAMQVFGDFGDTSVTMVSLSRNLDWRTQTRTLRVKFPSNAAVADGQTVYLLLPEIRSEDGFWLPKEALLEDVRGTWAVYQLRSDTDGQFQVVKRSVRSLYQYRGRVFVDGELASGDLVISAGTQKYAPGQIVTATVDARAPVAGAVP